MLNYIIQHKALSLAFLAGLTALSLPFNTAWARPAEDHPAPPNPSYVQGKNLSASGKAVHVPSSKKATTRGESMSWLNLSKNYPNAFVLNGPRSKRRVALTFDDAPDPRFTPAILDMLAKYDVCATFFIVGNRAAKHPELVKRMQREGHIIGNHSYNHAVLSKLTANEFHQQILRTDGIINRIIGYHPRFIRPPYGEMLPSQVEWTRKNGYIVVNWDSDSNDWKNNPSSGTVLRNIKKTLQPGSIVLQHAGGGSGQDLSGTVQALPLLITQLRQKGYEIVTLPELLGQSPRKTK